MTKIHGRDEMAPLDAVRAAPERAAVDRSRSVMPPTPIGRRQPCPACGSESVAELWIGWYRPAGDPSFEARLESGELVWDLGCEWAGEDLTCNGCGCRFRAVAQP